MKRLTALFVIFTMVLSMVSTVSANTTEGNSEILEYLKSRHETYDLMLPMDLFATDDDLKNASWYGTSTLSNPNILAYKGFTISNWENKFPSEKMTMAFKTSKLEDTSGISKSGDGEYTYTINNIPFSLGGIAKSGETAGNAFLIRASYDNSAFTDAEKKLNTVSAAAPAVYTDMSGKLITESSTAISQAEYTIEQTGIDSVEMLMTGLFNTSNTFHDFYVQYEGELNPVHYYGVSGLCTTDFKDSVYAVPVGTYNDILKNDSFIEAMSRTTELDVDEYNQIAGTTVTSVPKNWDKSNTGDASIYNNYLATTKYNQIETSSERKKLSELMEVDISKLSANYSEVPVLLPTASEKFVEAQRKTSSADQDYDIYAYTLSIPTDRNKTVKSVRAAGLLTDPASMILSSGGFYKVTTVNVVHGMLMLNYDGNNTIKIGDTDYVLFLDLERECATAALLGMTLTNAESLQDRIDAIDAEILDLYNKTVPTQSEFDALKTKVDALLSANSLLDSSYIKNYGLFDDIQQKIDNNKGEAERLENLQLREIYPIDISSQFTADNIVTYGDTYSADKTVYDDLLCTAKRTFGYKGYLYVKDSADAFITSLKNTEVSADSISGIYTATSGIDYRFDGIPMAGKNVNNAVCLTNDENTITFNSLKTEKLALLLHSGCIESGTNGNGLKVVIKGKDENNADVEKTVYLYVVYDNIGDDASSLITKVSKAELESYVKENGKAGFEEINNVLGETLTAESASFNDVKFNSENVIIGTPTKTMQIYPNSKFNRQYALRDGYSREFVLDIDEMGINALESITFYGNTSGAGTKKSAEIEMSLNTELANYFDSTVLDAQTTIGDILYYAGAGYIPIKPVNGDNDNFYFILGGRSVINYSSVMAITAFNEPAAEKIEIIEREMLLVNSIEDIEKVYKLIDKYIDGVKVKYTDISQSARNYFEAFKQTINLEGTLNAEQKGNTVLVTAQINNAARDAGKPYMLAVGYYDKNYNMISIDCESYISTASKEITTEFISENIPENTAYAKAFMWKDLGNLMPLANSVDIVITAGLSFVDGMWIYETEKGMWYIPQSVTDATYNGVAEIEFKPYKSGEVITVSTVGESDAQINKYEQTTSTENIKFNVNINPDVAAVEIDGYIIERKEAEAKIAEIYDDKQAIVTFTFDDSKYDAAVFYNEKFEKYGVKGTAVMHTTPITSSSEGVENTVKKWQELFAQGNFDLGNHGTKHSIYTELATRDEVDEQINGAYKQLKNWFPEQNILTFSYPNGKSNDMVIDVTNDLHYAGRSAGGNASGFISPVNPDETQWYTLPSFTATPYKTLSEFNEQVDKAISNTNGNNWFIELWHGVIDDDAEVTSGHEYSIRKGVCEEHMAYVKSLSDKVWCATFTEATQYLREKQNAKLNIISSGNKITVSVKHTLDEEIFNFPLTVKVKKPSDWENARAVQDGKEIQVEIKNGYIYVNADVTGNCIEISGKY